MAIFSLGGWAVVALRVPPPVPDRAIFDGARCDPESLQGACLDALPTWALDLPTAEAYTGWRLSQVLERADARPPRAILDDIDPVGRHRSWDFSLDLPRPSEDVVLQELAAERDWLEPPAEVEEVDESTQEGLTLEQAYEEVSRRSLERGRARVAVRGLATDYVEMRDARLRAWWSEAAEPGEEVRVLQRNRERWRRHQGALGVASALLGLLALAAGGMVLGTGPMEVTVTQHGVRLGRRRRLWSEITGLAWRPRVAVQSRRGTLSSGLRRLGPGDSATLAEASERLLRTASYAEGEEEATPEELLRLRRRLREGAGHTPET